MMKRFANIVTALIILIISLQNTICSNEYPNLPALPANQQYVSVTLIAINAHRVKRKVKMESEQDNKGDVDYNLNVRAFDTDYDANLVRPRESIFTPNFQAGSISVDNNGELSLQQDAQLTDEYLQSIEKNHFVDAASNSAIAIEDSEDGVRSVRGVVGGEISLSPHPTNDDLHIATKRSSDEEEISFNDYIEYNRTLTPAVMPRADDGNKTEVTPEVLVILDYGNYVFFKRNRTKILNYLGLFYRGVNNRYSTIEDPKIVFRISGVWIVTDPNAEEFLTSTLIPNGQGNDIKAALDGAALWLYDKSNTNSAFPKFDVANVITARELLSFENGVYKNSTAGLAYIKGACDFGNDNKSVKAVSISEDKGGIYKGVSILAHELAHLLGTAHDGEGNSITCPWKDGYIMSYEGGGTKNHLFFSPCSIQSMKVMVTSMQGECLRKVEYAEAVEIPSKSLGDIYTLKQQCQMLTGNTKAIPNPNVKLESMCLNLQCYWTTPNGMWHVRTMKAPAWDNTPCNDRGPTKRCKNGDCVIVYGAEATVNSVTTERNGYSYGAAAIMGLSFAFAMSK